MFLSCERSTPEGICRILVGNKLRWMIHWMAADSWCESLGYLSLTEIKVLVPTRDSRFKQRKSHVKIQIYTIYKALCKPIWCKSKQTVWQFLQNDRWAQISSLAPGEDARVRDIGDDIKIERPFWKLPNSNLSLPRVVCVSSKGKVTSVTRWQPPKKDVWARHSKKKKTIGARTGIIRIMTKIRDATDK